MKLNTLMEVWKGVCSNPGECWISKGSSFQIHDININIVQKVMFYSISACHISAVFERTDTSVYKFGNSDSVPEAVLYIEPIFVALFR